MYTAVIVGSGFSGLCLGIKLKENGIDDFIILEKASEVGGTWRENTYPGAECDIPSALYSYSFEPYPNWEHKWSHQPQIFQYLKHCAHKYKLYEHIHFNKSFKSSRWNDDQKYWQLETSDGTLFQTKTFTIAIGQLHIPQMPNIEGLESYEGHSFHSAQWDHNCGLKGKNVGVIGNAASAIQFIPQIAKTAKEVTIFQRSANWMLPKQDRLYKAWEKSLVRVFPFLLKLYRFRIWVLGGGLYFLMKNGSNLLRSIYQKKTVKYVTKTIDDPELRKKLIPSYPMGAKRILFSDDYYNALNRQNVHLVTELIECFSKSGVVTYGGIPHKFEILIFATGFKTNPFFEHLVIKGPNKLLSDYWRKESKSYFGISVPHFPNMFIMYGPNTNLGHNSIIIMSEAQAGYIAQCICLISEKRYKSIQVKVSVTNEHYETIQKRLKEMIWNSIDNSWYKSSSGSVPNNWPGRTMEYVRSIKSVRKSDYIFE